MNRTTADRHDGIVVTLDEKYPCISVKTEHGTVSAYADTDPACAGIYVCFTPEGCTTAEEIDIAAVEDPSGGDSVHIFDYADPYTEDRTQEHTLPFSDIAEALHLTGRDD